MMDVNKLNRQLHRDLGAIWGGIFLTALGGILILIVVLLTGCGSDAERTHNGMDTVWSNVVAHDATDQLCQAWQDVPEKTIAGIIDGFTRDPSYGPDFHPDRTIIADYLDQRCGR